MVEYTCLEFICLEHACSHQLLLEPSDGVLRLPHLLDLVARAVGGAGVGHGVTVVPGQSFACFIFYGHTRVKRIPVGCDLKDEGPFA